QGGVGKSTMAEYMVQRAVSKNPAKTVPVIITDKVNTIDDVIKTIESAMTDTGEIALINLTISAKSIREPLDRLNALLRAFTKESNPVLVFDNLETFQPSSV
ncbi:MAG: hypothetical protein H7844_15490, partial [Nitrospirae bacterium YQR-1]